MKVNEIIRARRKELGLTLKQVADKLGVSESLISRYESNDVKNMGIDKLIPLAKILKTTPAYLMGWEDEKNHSEKTPYNEVSVAEPQEQYNISNKKITYEKLIPIEIVEIPMYGKASAGNGYINLEQEIGSYTIPKHIYKKGIFAIRVSGDSMTGIDKSIPDGSTAVVDPELCTDPINLNNKVCVFEYNDETYIKQLIIDKQGIIRLRSFNSDYDDIIVLNEKLLLCKGRVIRTFVENQW
jgi:putative prophage lambdaCh01, repressor protein